MKLSPNDILSTQAVVTESPGGWLAVSAPGSTLRIGVAGTTRSRAERGFAAEIKAWAALAEKP